MSFATITGFCLVGVDVSAFEDWARLESDSATFGICGDFGDFGDFGDLEAISAMCGFFGGVYGLSRPIRGDLLL